VALQMKKLGFVRVHLLMGGLQGWLDLDLPVESRDVVEA
jgi:3-mercaptopyruvate sulfurtransferase SseA